MSWVICYLSLVISYWSSVISHWLMAIKDRLDCLKRLECLNRLNWLKCLNWLTIINNYRLNMEWQKSLKQPRWQHWRVIHGWVGLWFVLHLKNRVLYEIWLFEGRPGTRAWQLDDAFKHTTLLIKCMTLLPQCHQVSLRVIMCLNFQFLYRTSLVVLHSLWLKVKVLLL